MSYIWSIQFINFKSCARHGFREKFMPSFCYNRKAFLRISCMVFFFFCILLNVKANEEPISTNIKWSFSEDGVLKLEGKGEMDFRYFPWYDYKKKIRKVFISEGITTIQPSAFKNCYNIEEISLPKTLKVIGVCAFYAGTHRLRNIVIPDSVERIESLAFAASYGVEKIIIGKSVKYISDRAFYGCCNKLKEIVIPSSVTFIGGSAFEGCSSLKKATFEHGLDNPISLGGSTFCECDSLTTCKLPLSLKDIPSSTFRKCPKLEKIIIPDGVKSIGAWAFQGCSNLTEILLPASVEELSERVFGDTNLRLIQFPNRIVKFYDFAFSGCQSIEYLINPYPEPYFVNDDLGLYLDKTTLVVPDASVEKYKNAQYWKNFKQVIGLSTYKLSANITQQTQKDCSFSNRNGYLKIDNVPIGQNICIYDIHGRLLEKGICTSGTYSFRNQESLVIVTIGNKSYKVTISK